MLKNCTSRQLDQLRLQRVNFAESSPKSEHNNQSQNYIA